MVRSHRHLTIRHAQRLLFGATQDLLPGEVRFFSYYRPSLQGGLHGIHVSQSIDAPPEKEDQQRRTPTDGHGIPDNDQYFYVVAPKFALPPDSVDSTYPANGDSAEATVLPHIVFKDPHLPWARAPTWINKDQETANTLSRTPWLVLLTFTVDELQIKQQQLDGMLQGLPTEANRAQSETLAVKMQASDTCLLSQGSNVTNPIPYDKKWDTPESDKQIDVVFLKRDLFVSLFSSDDASNNATFDVSKYKYMSHVLQVATDGMAVGGAQADTDIDKGLYGITVSHRTGPIGRSTPTTTVVHLVSLAMNSNLKPADIPDTSDQRVAMVSLHSWTYTCLPSVDDENTWPRLENLGTKLNVLYPQNAIASTTAAAAASVDEIITKRQNDGYTLVRYRTITGDITAGMYRGPLTPNFVPRWDHKKLNMQSNFGTDLQILDPKLSIMDLTYSSAWQLGKTLAMGDEAFTAALSRLRNLIHGNSLRKSKIDVHSALGTYSSRGDTALRMVELVESLHDLNNNMHILGSQATAADSNRWDWCHDPHPSAAAEHTQHIDISMHSSHISPRIAAHATATALSAITTADGTTLYNEHNVPNNTDMAHVYSWVMDKLHLDNIPAYYLLPDPSFLPGETLRFFYIDENWTDAVIDGALSLANYWGQTPDQDCCRTAIKEAINERLKVPDPQLGGWHVQMPQYGFLLRSQLLVQFPDLAVAVKYSASRTQPLMHVDGTIDTSQDQPEQAPILVQKRLSDDTMYCLFDCVPPDLVEITFTLPPHQQRFIVGQELDDSRLKVSFKKQYTQPDRNSRKDKDADKPLRPQETLTEKDGLFNWSTRTVKCEAFALGLYKRLKGEDPFKPGMDPSDYHEEGPNSATLALQLNDPFLQLGISGIEDEQIVGSSSRERFQLSIPAKSQVEPPLLGPVAKRPPVTRNPILRPRPRSPRREATLVREYAMQAQAAAMKKAKTWAAIQANTTPRRKQTLIPGIWPRADDPDRPKFDLQVYPIRQRGFVPTNSKVPLDLVFSIRFDQTRTSPDYPLMAIHLLVRYGNEVSHNENDDTPLLADTLDPSPPTMLSNMRFNVVKGWYKDNGDNGRREERTYLKLDVLPRSEKGVAADKVLDASFLLSRVPIIGYTGSKPRLSYVSMRYEYLEGDKVADPGWDDGVDIHLKPF